MTRYLHPKVYFSLLWYRIELLIIHELTIGNGPRSTHVFLIPEVLNTVIMSVTERQPESSVVIKIHFLLY